MAIKNIKLSNGQTYSIDADVVVDPSMSDTSTNAVENKVIKAYVDAGLEAKQNKTDNSLNTTDKTVVGAINELKDGVDSTKIISLDSYLPEGFIDEIFAASLTGEEISKNILLNSSHELTSELKNKIKATINNDNHVLFSITMNNAPFVFNSYTQAIVDDTESIVAVIGEAIFPISKVGTTDLTVTNYSLWIVLQLVDSDTSVLTVKGGGEVLPLDKYDSILNQALDSVGQEIDLSNSDLVDYILTNSNKLFKWTHADSSFTDGGMMFMLSNYNINKSSNTKQATLMSITPLTIDAPSSTNPLFVTFTITNSKIVAFNNSLQLSTSDQLKTTSKEIVGAINELKTTTDTLNTNKQDKTDNTLATTSKTVVGAINEINAKIPALPEDATTKTYVLKAVNGVFQWVEEALTLTEA